jgi:hypothetical protein
MGSLTNFSELELLDHIFNAAYSPVATVYLALATADPTDAATGASMNEVPNANGYTRKAITFGAAASRRVTQSGAVTFDAASGAWGTVTHWAIVDSATHGAGNALAHGALSESKAVVAGNTPSVATTEVYVEITSEIGTTTANNLLNLMFRNVAYSKPDTYLALVTTVSSEAGLGTEVSGGSYARVQVNPNGGSSPTWDLAASGALDNTHDITFATATAPWGTVVGVAVMSAASSGTLLMYDNDQGDQAVGTDDIVKYLAGALDVELS